MRRIGSERNGMKTKWNKIISLAAAVMVGVSTLTGCTASSVPVSSNPDATEETAAAGPSASQASGAFMSRPVWAQFFSSTLIRTAGRALFSF